MRIGHSGYVVGADTIMCKPYEGLRWTNQTSWKLGLLGRKLKGNHSTLYGYFDRIMIK